MALGSLSPAMSRTATPFSSPNFPLFPSSKRSSIQPPSLLERRRKRCPTLLVSAFHTTPSCPHTQPGSRRATLYQVLDIPQSATKAEIKASYRRLARLYHPDLLVATEDKETSTKLFLQIHAAYTALSDAQSRARYDLQLSMQALQAAGCRRGTFSQAQDCSRPSQPSRSSFYRKGRNWETDQCWC